MVLLSVLLSELLAVLLPVVLSVALLVVIEDVGVLVDIGALDGPVVLSEFAPSLVLGTADEMVEPDEVDATESSDITEVVLEVDKRDDTPGMSTVTAAVASAVVLPSASTSAVTATTTSAFEFVLSILGNTAVPWRLRRRSCSPSL